MADEDTGADLREEPERGGRSAHAPHGAAGRAGAGQGPRKAAEELDVDHRTLTTSLQRGTLSRRMRVALDKALLEGGGSPAVEQRERNDELEGRADGASRDRVEAVEKEREQGPLASVQGDVKALREDHGPGGCRQLAKLEAGDARRRHGRWQGEAGTKSNRRTRGCRREFPDLVTRRARRGRRGRCSGRRGR